MRKTKKRAFTLIELLVVITIIGILAVGGIQVYTTQIQKARDSTRIKDIKILASGVEQYVLDNGKPYSGATNATAAVDNANIQNFRDAHKHYVPNIQNIYDFRLRGNLRCRSYDGPQECLYTYRNNLNVYKLAIGLESISNVCQSSEKCLATEDGGRYSDFFEIGTGSEFPLGLGNLGHIVHGSSLQGLNLYRSN